MANLAISTSQFYQAKSKENQREFQFQLELSLAQLSPSLLSISSAMPHVRDHVHHLLHLFLLLDGALHTGVAKYLISF